MVKEGELLTFSCEEKEEKFKISEIAKDFSCLTVIDDSNTLKQDKKYILSAVRKTGILMGEAVVSRISKPKDADYSENPALKGKLEYTLTIVKPFTKMQNRSFFRHDCSIPVEFIKSDSSHHQASLINLSAGGLKAATNAYFAPNELFAVRISLTDETIELVGAALGVDDFTKEHPGYNYAVRVKFIRIAKKYEEAIVKFIFSEFRKAGNKN